MSDYAQPLRYTETSSFDPASALQNLRESLVADSALSSHNAAVCEEELIKAANIEVKTARSQQLPRKEKSRIAAELLKGTKPYAEKIAEILKENPNGLPSVHVVYRNVTVTADALVGKAADPTVLNAFKGMIGRCLPFRKGLESRELKLLDDVSGILKPGRLTLLLGPPGAGKSVFMQLVSGRLRLHKGLQSTGGITYNGEKMKDFVVQRTAGLVDQYDQHIQNLKVIETVNFASHCQTSAADRARMLADVNRVAQKRKIAGEKIGDTAIGAEEGRADGTHGIGVTGASPTSLPKSPSGKGVGNDTVDDTDEFLELARQGVVNHVRPWIVLHLLGLADVAETFVGGETLRGISGGQRKRVTSAEVLVGPQWVLLLDEISTGLDSATTYSVVKSLKEACHALQRTIVISLLQPPPEAMFLFVDLLLMTDGKVIYHGPIKDATPFFASLGFICPPRKDPASFLQEVTTPLGQLTYATQELLDSHKVPQEMRDLTCALKTPPKTLLLPIDAIEKAFWESEHGVSMKAELQDQDDANSKGGIGHPAALARTHYALPGLKLAYYALRRQWILVKRDKAYYLARVIQAVVMGLIISSLFASVAPPSDSSDSSEVFSQGRKVIALAVISTIYLSMSSMPSLGFVFITKRVFYKHRDNHLLPPWSYTVGLLLAQLVPSTAESVLFTVVIYFISGLTRTASHFFIFLLTCWSASNCLAGFFRLIAYMTPSMVVGNATGALTLLLMMITNGFTIIRTSIPVYLIWIYYGLNPLAYGIRTLCINELTDARWGAAGPAILESFGIFTESYWMWIGIGYQWGYLLFLTALGALALRYTDPPAPKPTVGVEESKKEVDNEVGTYIKRRSQSGLSTGASAVVDNEGTTAAQSDSTAVEFVPITLCCRGISYYVNDPSGGTASGVVKDTEDKEIAGKLQLLHSIDFYAAPGELTALMGGSGAGKTTLMDVVAGRKTQGLIRGDILVNGRKKEQATWSRVVGYVEQTDIHSSCLTVGESLAFSARLRLDETKVSDAAVKEIVGQALDTIELRSLAASIVGEPGGSGLSIEQRKRLSIGVELVANPSVLFMDEPTSGLDARAAAIVMRAVRNVANGRRTIVVTIHQPSMEIFEAFDQLVLLQRGGKLTYFGPLGVESQDLIAYLQRLGCEPIRPGYNPSTWMLEVTGGSMTTTFQATDLDFPESYKESQLRDQNMRRLEDLASSTAATMPALAVSGKYSCCWQTQARELVKKYFSYYWRAPAYNFVRIIMTVCIALIYGITFLNIGLAVRPGSDGAGFDTVQNIMGQIFSLAIFLGMFNAMTVIPVTSAERIVYYRERSCSMYAPSMLAMAQGFAELPYLAVQAIIMICISYFMIGFQLVAWKFFYFLLMFFLGIAMYTYLGQCLVVATPNPLLAQLFAAFLNQLWTIFNGFLVPYNQTPAGWKWMNRISPTTWILYGLGGSQLADSQVPFTTEAAGLPPGATVGDFVQSFFGYDPGFVWWCPLIVLAYIVFFRAMTTFFMSYVNYQRR